ncbi:NYN domain-containing protein [Dictyobacter aurantiacus]|uniref:NYN domain-containing protein n=1 Tax=Dictyobacter aurantiacus TaxID=1936993 RepID=A0A401ZER7_9CHLR|nr:NYN domain-containing protein [Dictyobacter aurantiacus]GCE05198.1 hypothetical protein KDAU_25270 [Dictyobacter aurantiacus]
MTTQNTHHEHSDADASVVKHPSVPENETTVNSAASETASSEDVSNSAERQQEQETSAAAVDSASEQETSTEANASSADITESNEVPSATSEASEEIGNHSETPSQAEEQSESASEVQKEQLSAIDVPAIEEPVSTADGQQEAEITAASSTPDEQPADQEVTGPAHVEPVSEATTESAPEASSEEVTSETSTADLLNEVQEEITRLEQESLPEGGVVSGETSVASEKDSSDKEDLPVPDTTFPYVEGSDLIDTRAEEVRPFTDFIAEFRQAEAALQATLRDTQVEALTRLTTAAAEFANPEQQGGPELSELTEESSIIEVKTADAPKAEVPVAQEEQTTAISEEKPAVVASEEEPKPVTRPVSPLLRPASRLRLPRHGVFGRHTREEVQQPAAEEKPANVAKAESSTEAAAEATPPRPARRYRFDRPASTVTSSPIHTPARATGTVHTTQTAAQRKAEEKLQRAEEAKASQQEQQASTAPAPESPAANNKKHAGNNGVTQEAENNTTAQPAEQHGRRRHSQKEQAASHEPAVETPTPAVEQQGNNHHKEEIAPEDLPPLEYSELQKASSRRRRRHRSGSSNTTTSHANQRNENGTGEEHVPPSPTPAPAPMPAPLTRTPAASVESNNIYSIISGHTVNQMNQGNDMTGPFMGPEPSPARGSVLSRDGRNTRAESRPAPTPSLYPSSRSSEGGMSAAAMNQFANVVAQALQTQTDRMVSEFRRISQAPTNVSVTLPPFPSTERVGVFVDVANLLYSARTLRIGVDFGKLLDFLRGNRRLVRAHAYCPTSPQPGDEQMFLQAVKGLGYRITTKNYKTFSSGAKKADLDLDLCMDVVRLVDGGAVDCIVLVSGDSDFMPMLDYCSDHGVRVEVAAFDEAMSATLRQSCDLFINLSMLEEIRA